MALGDVRIRTTLVPDITFNILEPVKEGESGFAKFIQPEITIDLPAVGVKTYAPFGSPTTNYFPFIVGAVAIGLIFLVARHK